MTTVGDLVDKTRQMVWGSISEPMNVLAEDYTAGGDTIKLQYSTRGIGMGSLVSCGLNTFYVLAQSGDERTLTVIPAADGGPDDDCLAGSIVRLKPKATTWSIFREIHDAIVDMSSPRTGLFVPLAFEANPHYNSDLYTVPEEWLTGGVDPQRLVRARYKIRGEDTWQPLHSVDWMAERWAVRIYFPPDNASKYEFTFGFPYVNPTSLADDVADLGLQKSTQDIPPLRAAQRLALSVEGRRAQPFAQGDSRRPEEVPVTASLGVSRDFGREYREAVMAERSRLQAMFSFQTRVGDES